MDLRELVELGQRGASPTELTAYTKGITTVKVSETAKDIVDFIQKKPEPFLASPIDQSELSDIAFHFHEKAGTLTSGVKSNLDLLSAGAYRLRMAHQTNLFLSMAVGGQLILLNKLSKFLQQDFGLITAQIYVALDYDIAQDSRFRISHYPDAGRSGGTLSLSGAVLPSMYNKPMFVVPKPERVLIADWLHSIKISTRENLAILNRNGFVENKRGSIYGSIAEAEDVIWKAYERATSFIEFNAFVLSDIVNNYWNLPTAFVFGSKLQPLMKTGYEFVLQKRKAIAEAANEACDFFNSQGITLKGFQRDRNEVFPIWYLCNHCKERIELIKQTEDPLTVVANCSACDSNYEFNLEAQKNLSIAEVAGSVTPRILMDNFLDTVALGIVGGSGYIGQAEHLIFTNFVASKVGWQIPPQSLHMPRSFYGTMAEYRAAVVIKSYNQKAFLEKAQSALRWVYSGRASMLYYIVNLGLRSLYHIWENHFNEEKEALSGNFFTVSDEMKGIMDTFDTFKDLSL